MKNIYERYSAKPWKAWFAGVGLAVCVLALCLPAMARAQEGFPGEEVDSRIDRVLEGNRQIGEQSGEEEQEGSFIGTNEEGDSIMRTAPRRPQSGGVGEYEDGLFIAPQIEPIVPLPPRPRPPVNPYPGPGPHPGPMPRDGINQRHEYNYNPEYPMEVPRRHFGDGFRH